MSAPAGAVLPDRFGLTLDRSIRSFRAGRVLVGGHPGRLISLTAAGAASLAGLLAGGPVTSATRRLAARLVEAGMAHPLPPEELRRHHLGPTSMADEEVADEEVADEPPSTPQADPERGGPEVTVIVPARDRTRLLDRCLAALGRRSPVLVVDDGSVEADDVASVCARHGAHLVTRGVSGGPAAARNDALGATGTELVAMVDSDCTVTNEWLDGLLWLFEDPSIAAVAPRVRPAPVDAEEDHRRDRSRRVVARFASAASPLDLGPEQGEVGPERPVRYVPTTALVARRSALGSGFDPRLSVGEDVDLVWRLLDEGWRVRYVPSVTVHHAEPTSWTSWLARRFRYGTSVGPLGRRHGRRLAHVELRTWPTAIVLCALARRWRMATAVYGVAALSLASRLRGTGVPPRLAFGWTAQSAAWTAVGLGRAATMLYLPLVVTSGLRSKRNAIVAGLCICAPPLVDWGRTRPDLDPVRYVLASVADQVAYGAGVWAGCLRTRSLRPLVPARGGDGR